MSRRQGIIPAILPVLVVAGCVGTGVGVNQGGGTPAGAGAVAGSQIGSGLGRSAAIKGGAVVGAVAESEIGRRLDKKDLQAIARAEYQALESAGPNRPVSWRNPRSGRRGHASAGPAYFVNDQKCRDYAHTIYLDGRPEMLRGTACRNQDGTWRKVS